MDISRVIVVLLAAATFTSAASAAEFDAGPEDGIAFLQLDYPGNTPPVPDSSVGKLQANLLTLRASSGIPSGYINVVLEDEWVVRNVLVPLEQDYPYSHLSSEFDLGISAGTNVSQLNAVVLYSDAVAEAAPDGLALAFPVGAQVIDTGGMGTNGTRGAGGSSTPPDVNDVLFGNPGSTRALFQLDHPNIETANNQCYPMAVANSLQFLADTTDLVLPHSHVPGIKGDNSLVGQLDTAMNRTVVSRANGAGVHDIPGINGKLKYLAENGLQDRIETRHWGRYSGAVDGNHTVNGRTASSVAGGLALPFDEILDALERGENCEAAYSFPGGGHAIDLVAAGYTNGQPWIIEGSDINQASDSAGAGPQGFIFSHLKDTDQDGDYNLNGGAKELDLLICQRFVPAPDPDASYLPPPTGVYTIPGAGVIVTQTTDPAGHSCCVGNPPSTVNLMFEAGNIVITGNTTWFPFTAATEAGEFEGENETVVAGFPGVTNTLSGTINADSLEATVTLGTLGELPGGMPIAWNLRITPPAAAWPWLAPMQLNSGIKPRVRINGFRTEVRVEAGDPVSVNLSLGVDGETAGADWFLAQRTANGVFYSYTLSSGWVPGLVPALQAPLRDVDNMPIFSRLEGLQPGEYSLYFGVDTNMNGVLDTNVMSYDSVKLLVEPSGN